MSKKIHPGHPGQYIRECALPKGVSVTEAAKTLGVGRPALSNFLNGKAALSMEMARRLQKAFGADADDLIRRQAEYDSFRQTDNRAISAPAHRYVPPFLKATANDIEQWAGKLDSRSQLAVLLRRLVNSTCDNLQFVDFPGNDDAQRPGWDGRVETDDGNPWVPQGMSGWEFGTNRDVARKANKDYANRTASTPESERQNTAFVFVTPRRWPDKDNWLDKKRAEGMWESIWAWDSSDIEQWLEQSIPAQAWFGNQCGLNVDGVKSLNRCWVEWCADCRPCFTEHIFDEAISASKGVVVKHLRNSVDGPLRIVADSREEALAFLYVLFSEDDYLRRSVRDKVVVFTEVGPLRALAIGSPGFVPIIANPDVAKELAQSGCRIGSIVVEPRTAAHHGLDVTTLEPLSHSAFNQALMKMGLGRDEIERLKHESGRSLTVLRRRLAQSADMRSPEWGADQKLARTLFPLMLAGAWKTDNYADRYLMSELLEYDDYEEVEHCFNRLLNLDESPVWTTGGFSGVVSKIDVLYAVHQWVTKEQILRFFTVAGIVLSDPDPSLDLPEDEQWAAEIHGKRREISAPLRKGVAESLVLLAIHGARLFRDRIGLDAEHEVEELVVSQLGDMSANKLQAQASNLPLYAEAAPDKFLSILERHVQGDNTGIRALMKPADTSPFGRNDRVHLLWALEILAWNPKWLGRVVELLACLAEIEPDDNLVNKPSTSLQSIFRSLMPQTAASLEGRIATFDCLVRQHPNVAWKVAVAQFESVSQIGDCSRKPMWRDYALGFGELVTEEECRKFTDHCVQTCLDWPVHTRETLDDIVNNAERFDHRRLSHFKKALSDWAKTAEDRDRAWLRERIRVFTRRSTRRVRHQSESRPVSSTSEDFVLMAKKAFEILEPGDLIWKHAWLFQSAWVQEPWDKAKKGMDLKSRDQWVESRRVKAAWEVFSETGYDGLLRLAFTGNAPSVAGEISAKVISAEEDRLAFVRMILKNGDVLSSLNHQALLQGFLQAIGTAQAMRLIETLWLAFGECIGIKLLCLSAFDRLAWTRVEEMGETVSAEYWSSVDVSWLPHAGEEGDINYAVTKLLDAKRAFTALDYAQLDWGHIESESIYRILADLPFCEEPNHNWVQVEKFAIEQAFKVLNERGALSCSDMARLEFQYLELFWFDEGSAPNLEKEIEADPALFCEAVMFAYKREDSNEHREPTEKERAMAQRAYKLLDMLSLIPGNDENGNLTAEKLEKWMFRARELCVAKGRQISGDHHIGQLLSHAPEGKDGVWPCEPVREVLERVWSDDIRRGFEIGRRNSRGAHWRKAGGDQERELAERYEEWAKASDYSYPRVAAALRGLAESYQREARWHDQKAAVQRRLGY